MHEETQTGRRFGRVMNANIAGYHVPVNADGHDLKVICVDEPDTRVNPLGIKGLVGVAAAIANAVHRATGKRVRDLPITLDEGVGWGCGDYLGQSAAGRGQRFSGDDSSSVDNALFAALSVSFIFRTNVGTLLHILEQWREICVRIS